MSNIPFQTIDWTGVEQTIHKGEIGIALWKTLQFEDTRVRIVEYSAGYLADHWCRKGHIVHCLRGSFTSELSDGTSYTLEQGMSYIVSDEMSEHRSLSANGVQLLIIDGDFLSP